MLRIIVLLAVAAAVVAPPSEAVAATVTLDPSIVHQTILGWASGPEAGQVDEQNGGISAAFPNYQVELLDRAHDELGITRLSLVLHSGVENPTDWFGMYLAGEIPRSEWRRNEIIPDNADPMDANLAGFQFTHIDLMVDTIVEPLRQRMIASGRNPTVNLLYVDEEDSAPGGHRGQPDEYAELILVAFQHLQSRYGWVPDTVEVVLEPNLNAWSGQQMGQILVGAGARLAAAGFHPGFVGPSTSSPSTAVPWFDDMVGVPNALGYLTELGFHRYGAAHPHLADIASRAQANGLDVSMTEHIRSGVVDLHEDLTIGSVSSWQQFVLAFPSNQDDGSKYYRVDATAPANPQISLEPRARYLRHYFRFVRPGATRIDARADVPHLYPVAFTSPAGDLVVVVRTERSGVFEVAGLPAGLYGVQYTVGADDGIAPLYEAVDLPFRILSAGETLAVDVPPTLLGSTLGLVSVYGIADEDGDAVPDQGDNCRTTPNPNQRDSNVDGFGNACDFDLDNDGVVGISDFNRFRDQVGLSSADPGYDPDADVDGDGFVGSSEFALLVDLFGTEPGPSGAACAGAVPCAPSL